MLSVLLITSIIIIIINIDEVSSAAVSNNNRFVIIDSKNSGLIRLKEDGKLYADGDDDQALCAQWDLFKIPQESQQYNDIVKLRQGKSGPYFKIQNVYKGFAGEEKKFLRFIKDSTNIDSNGKLGKWTDLYLDINENPSDRSIQIQIESAFFGCNPENEDEKFIGVNEHDKTLFVCKRQQVDTFGRFIIRRPRNINLNLTIEDFTELPSL